MPNFKDEHIIIIAPGSQMTLAQLGLPESFTTPKLRVKSRMFPAERKGEWEPYRVRKKRKTESSVNGNIPAPKVEDAVKTDDSATAQSHTNGAEQAEDEVTLEEDYSSDEGAVWPIQGGRIVNWPCFYALMHHVHNLLNAPFHTPILLIAQPCWTNKEHEKLTQFFFEKFKTPGFALMDSAQAATYAYGLQTACVVDVGKDKADVTAITDFIINDIGRSSAVPGCGGEAMTQTLLEMLGSKGWNRNMCEQLKKSSICEILPPGVPIPKDGVPTQQQQQPAVINPAAQVSTGADGSGADQRHTQGAQGVAPRGPGQDTEVGAEGNNKDELEDNEGVLDVASIVTSGNMTDYLAKKEREKAERAEKAAARRSKAAGGDQAAKDAMAKPIRKKNSEKEKATFFYEDHALLEALKNTEGMDTKELASAKAALDETPAQRKLSVDTTNAPQSINTESQDQHPPSAISPTSPTITKPTNNPQSTIRRELTVASERFLALSQDQTATLTTAIHLTISAIPSASLRSSLWENLIITGCGAKVRGFKEALLHALSARFLISPSSATMFTSELPSSFSSTPIHTPGTSTPVPQAGAPASSQQPGGAGVNPLLHAATTAHAFQQAALTHQHHTPGAPAHQLAPPAPQTPHRPLQHPHPHPSSLGHHTPTAATATHAHHLQAASYSASQSQTPTAIRTPKLPDYFSEWKAAGPDAEAEALFLGAQIAARLVFMMDTSALGPGGVGGAAGGYGGGAGGGSVQAKGYMSRVDYNEVGPGGIGEFIL